MAKLAKWHADYTKYDVWCHLLFEITQCYKYLIHISFFYQQKSNWLFGHYETLVSLRGEIFYIDSEKIQEWVTPNSEWH